VLCLTANAIGEPATAAPGLLVAALANVKHILVDTLGRQHVILNRRTAQMHLVASGHAVVIAPVILGLRIEQGEEIGATAQRLARLERLVSARPDEESPPWTAQTLWLHDALIALDGHCAGATLRQIAAVIYGRRRVEEDWPGKGLRQRVRRARERGLALCHGGYRDLLSRQGCPI
jgi:hypothetical protein